MAARPAPSRPHLQHAREAGPLVLAGRAKVHGPGDVGCAAVVLAARVQEQQRVRAHCAAGARLGSVVDDRTVGARA